MTVFSSTDPRIPTGPPRIAPDTIDPAIKKGGGIVSPVAWR